MNRRIRGRAVAAIFAFTAVAGVAACASLGLGDIVKAPEFRSAEGFDPNLSLVGPSSSNPLGGARVRLYARVNNPNAFGLTLASLAGTLFLQEREAATVSFPLGLPLLAGQDTVIPLDITVGFDDIGNLADVVRNAVNGGSLGYRLNGTVGVDAGALGQPSFGPMNLLEGTVR